MIHSKTLKGGGEIAVLKTPKEICHFGREKISTPSKPSRWLPLKEKKSRTKGNRNSRNRKAGEFPFKVVVRGKTKRGGEVTGKKKAWQRVNRLAILRSSTK